MRAGNSSTKNAAIGPYTIVTYTIITSSTMKATGQLILLGSSLAGNLASASAWPNAFGSALSTRVSFTVTTTALPASAGVEVNDRPCLVMKSRALSQSLKVDHGPTKTCRLQLSAATVILLVAWNATRSGLMAPASAPNSQK